MKSNRAVKWTAWAVVGVGLGWLGAVAGGCAGFGELALGGCGDPCEEKTGAGGTGGTGGTAGTGGVGGTGGATPCTSDASCEPQDDNPCTTPKCSSDGTCSEPNDDTAVPPGGSECEVFSCKGGEKQTTKPGPETACGPNPAVDMTHCDGMGFCVGCMNKGMCHPDEECRTWDCVSQKCVSTDLAAGVIPDATGNCTRTRCDGEGVLVTEADSNDAFDDGKECTTDTCEGMTPTNTNKDAGTACGDPPKCDMQDPAVTKPQDTCDGDGVCVPGTPKGCAPYACDAGGTGECKTNCTVVTQDQDCVDANCVGGLCVAKLGNGATCQSAVECLSNFCVDGVCCNSACDTSCNSCNLGGGSPGACAPLPKGVPDDCMMAKVCSAGTCVNPNGKKAVGAPCGTNPDCFNWQMGGFSECVNGLCRLDVGEACDLDKPHYCATNLCDATTHTCQKCMVDGDCPGGFGCDELNMRCYLGAGAVCGTSADCTPGHSCVLAMPGDPNLSCN